jgi:hypothetical protein
MIVFHSFGGSCAAQRRENMWERPKFSKGKKKNEKIP